MIISCTPDQMHTLSIYLRNRNMKSSKLTYEDYLYSVANCILSTNFSVGERITEPFASLLPRLREFLRIEAPWGEEEYIVAREGDNLLLITGFTFISPDVSVVNMAMHDAVEAIVEVSNARTA